MQHRADYAKRYLEVIEELQAKNPTDRELVKSVYEGSLRNNKFEKAAKMASQLNNKFKETKYCLI